MYCGLFCLLVKLFWSLTPGSYKRDLIGSFCGLQKGFLCSLLPAASPAGMALSDWIGRAALRAPCRCVMQDCGDKCVWVAVPGSVTLQSPKCISLGARRQPRNIGALLWASCCSSLLYGEAGIAPCASGCFALGFEQDVKDPLLYFFFSLCFQTHSNSEG